MSGADEQRAILDTEVYWFGRVGVPAYRPSDGCSTTAPDGQRRIRAYLDTDGVWTVAIDEA